jgi:uncharacterized protein (TIGR02118 family)
MHPCTINIFQENPMIKVSVLYPNSDGANFDIDYYCNKHMPMVRDQLGATLQDMAVEKGIADGPPGAKTPYLASGHLFFESVEAFHKAFDPKAQAILGDIPNYTNVQPLIQVGEVRMNARRSETGTLHLHQSDMG